MSTYIIRVDPDGTITECEGTNLIAVATEWLQSGLDIITCHHQDDEPAEFPMFHVEQPYLVGAVAEWGRSETPVVNPKAWGLYGRSPLAGSVFIACDQYEDSVTGQRPPLQPMFIQSMRTDWVQPPTMIVSAMKRIAKGEGLAWPGEV